MIAQMFGPGFAIFSAALLGFFVLCASLCMLALQRGNGPYTVVMCLPLRVWGNAIIHAIFALIASPSLLLPWCF